jgi:hypothetical protein
MEFENESGEFIKFVWQCEEAVKRDDFLDTLWKLSENFLKKSDRPRFVDYEFKGRADDESKDGGGESTDQANNSLLVNQGQSLEISKSDEESLLKLMAECDFQSSFADNFVQKIQNELTMLDAVI